MLISEQTKQELKRLVEVVFTNEQLFIDHFKVPGNYSLEEFRVSVSSCEFQFLDSYHRWGECLPLDEVLEILKDNGVTL